MQTPQGLNQDQLRAVYQDPDKYKPSRCSAGAVAGVDPPAYRSDALCDAGPLQADESACAAQRQTDSLADFCEFERRERVATALVGSVAVKVKSASEFLSGKYKVCKWADPTPAYPDYGTVKECTGSSGTLSCFWVGVLPTI